MLKNYYFTFGSDPRYPYGENDYVIVRAGAFSEALEKYKACHPEALGDQSYHRRGS